MTALLEVRGLRKDFAVRRRGPRDLFARARFVHAVNGVSFSIGSDETFGLVGESGSGKTTVGRIIARLIEPTAGGITFDGSDWLALKGRQLRRRRRDIQMVFQNPYMSLDPRWTVEQAIAEPLVTHAVVPPAGIRDRVNALLAAVGLDSSHLHRYPHQFSGGQRQRIGIARAIAAEPKLLIADEPVSALDVSVRAQILAVLDEIRSRQRFAMIFISHDLSVVRYISSRMGVMYLGELVEVGPTAEIFARPLHPYTAALLSAVPQPVPGRRLRRVSLPGEPPSPVDLPQGCPFAGRCPVAEARCRVDKPALAAAGPGRVVACHFPDRAMTLLSDAPPAPPPDAAALRHVAASSE